MASKKRNEVLSPQQQLFIQNYLDPKSKNFGNALQSALTAGYSDATSKNITVNPPAWLSEVLGKSRKIVKAERNLDMALDGLLDDPEKGKKDIQWKATEFSLKTLRGDVYSHQVDHNVKADVTISFDTNFNNA